MTTSPLHVNVQQNNDVRSFIAVFYLEIVMIQTKFNKGFTISEKPYLQEAMIEGQDQW